MWTYVRPNGKCPAEEFLRDECEEKDRKKFMGSFAAAVTMGSDYMNHERFHPLHDEGKPLWEFKEFKCRLFCFRGVTGKTVRIILLNGWKKDKAGRGNREEDGEIQKAKHLFDEWQESREERKK